MSRFREQKMRLKALLAENGWKQHIDAGITDPEAARDVLNPLLALLARPELRWQAAYGLGLAVPLMAEEAMENARVVMRRFMWSLNEESGNLGWGIPEAMACILANSPALAREYARIFFSYGYETGKDDNFLDYVPLRRGVFWGMGRIAQNDPETAYAALPHLTTALGDDDRLIRGLAAWAVARLAEGTKHPVMEQAAERHGATQMRERPGAEAWTDARRALDKAVEQESAPEERIELFDGETIAGTPVRTLYRDASEAVGRLIQR